MYVEILSSVNRLYYCNGIITLQLKQKFDSFEAIIFLVVSVSAKDYGLFLADGDIKNKGIWLEPGRNLDYYILKNGEELEYRRKMRTLKVRMLDGTLKTLLVDDSQPVANLMVVICTKIGITNHDEYSLVRENPEDEVENKPNFGTLTLKRKKEEKERDVKMEQLRKKLKTDDEGTCIPLLIIDRFLLLFAENEYSSLRNAYIFSFPTPSPLSSNGNCKYILFVIHIF